MPRSVLGSSSIFPSAATSCASCCRRRRPATFTSTASSSFTRAPCSWPTSGRRPTPRSSPCSRPTRAHTSAPAQAANNASLAKFIGELQEPAIGAKHCIPWLGEVAAKEKALRLCAAGKLAINLRGLELLQAQPGESEDAAWMRIKGKLGTGKELEQTILQPPGAVPASGGTLPLVFTQTPATTTPQAPAQLTGGGGMPGSLFGNGEGSAPAAPSLEDRKSTRLNSS